MQERSDFRQCLRTGWQLISAEQASSGGGQISQPDFAASDWYACQVPTTVLGALHALGQVPDPNYGSNLAEIDPKPFETPWWFRTTFDLRELKDDEIVLLDFLGVNHQAHLWINGEQVKQAAEEGAFRQFQVDITHSVRAGQTNVLALEIFPPRPGDFSIGFVDWNPGPPDRSMGIFRDIVLRIVKGVSLDHPFVATRFADQTLQEAHLSVDCQLVNHRQTAVSGRLVAQIGSDTFSQAVTLAAGQTLQCRMSADEHPELRKENPSLWWPTQMGEPILHTLDLAFTVDAQTTDACQSRFGIRTIEDYFNEGGHRSFKVNGRDLLIKGAGWTDDIFLRDNETSLRTQIQYVKHMGLNCIRLEGFWGKDQILYDLCDENGILIMAGWSCHWEHESYLGKEADNKYGGILSSDDIHQVATAWQDQLLWLRHHASIFVWTVGSDKLPHPELEKKYQRCFEQFDQTRPYLNSTGGVGSEQGIITDATLISEISGSSGVKMLGPYDHTPPIYWYTNKHLGGAYGFNTETGPGANIPVAESLRRMLPPKYRWPINEMWTSHCATKVFNTMTRVVEAIEARYGASDDMESFARKAQLLNYELMRPQFEAFQAHRPLSTGVIQWMLNSAWSSMYWQLYDAYLIPTAAYYGTRKGCEPLHLIYNYGTKHIQLVNEFRADTEGLSARIRVLDLRSQVLSDETLAISNERSYAQEIKHLAPMGATEQIQFVDLQLLRAGHVISENFYWISAVEDELDYDAEFEDWAFYTPTRVHADFKALNDLPQAKLMTETRVSGRGDAQALQLQISNVGDALAFFVEVRVVDKKTGHSLVPILLDDNYFSILPQQSKHLSTRLPAGDAQALEVIISGWNVDQRTYPLARDAAAVKSMST